MIDTKSMLSHSNSYNITNLWHQTGPENAITTHFSCIRGFSFIENFSKLQPSLSPTDMTAITPLNTVTQFDRSTQLLSSIKYRELESNLW